MAVGVSLLQREVSLSALSISQPAVITPRPFSHRVQSARLLVSQGQQPEVDQSFVVTSEKFPDITKLKISQSDKNGPFSNVGDQQPAKGSAFPNFRFLQRLAASAKTRAPSDPKDGHLSHASNLNFSQKGDHHQLHSPESTKFENHSSEDIGVPVPGCPKGPHKKVKVKKPHKRLKKPKTPAKQVSPGRPDKQADLNSYLQLTSSKVVPTFSKRFTQHQKSRKRNSSEEPEKSSRSENCSIHFSAARFGESVNIPERSPTSNNSLGVGGIISVSNGDGRGSNQEASLRAIYETSANTAQSVPSYPSKRAKLRKVFQSEKQSPSISQCGRLLPCAPPTSPTPLVLEKYEIIPSLADFRSQQSIKQRLSALEKDAKKKQCVKEKQKQKREAELLQARLEAERTRTRQEIYALNKVMTKLERERFKKFQEQMKNR